MGELLRDVIPPGWHVVHHGDVITATAPSGRTYTIHPLDHAPVDALRDAIALEDDLP